MILTIIEKFIISLTSMQALYVCVVISSHVLQLWDWLSCEKIWTETTRRLLHDIVTQFCATVTVGITKQLVKTKSEPDKIQLATHLEI